MTLCAAWIRRVKSTEELVLITDSRVTGGMVWDACPKVFTFSRTDFALAFAHNTIYAYPAIEQIRSTIEAIPKIRSGASNLGFVRSTVLNVLETMRAKIHDRTPGLTEASDIDTQFLLAGFDWATEDFKLWRIYFSASEGRFTYDTAGRRGMRIMYAGDREAVTDMKRRLSREIQRKALRGNFDMEPFAALRDICREKTYQTIRGPLQMLKVYKHHNVMPYCVYWPAKASGSLTFLGRTLNDFEDMPFFRIDPDSMETFESFAYLPR